MKVEQWVRKDVTLKEGTKWEETEGRGAASGKQTY
jgi:hypothetical protein